MNTVLAAVDLGASSGRVMTGRVVDGRVELTQAHRFANGPVRLGGTLHWDVVGLYREILEGLRVAGRDGPVDSVGIDTWAVDYGLLDETGALLGNPVHYRDSRTAGVAAALPVAPGELYAATGLQVLPFNTIYQLVAAAGTPTLAAARDLLLIPDLLGYWLTGQRGAEVSNASTTGLFDPVKRTWDTGLAARVGIDPTLLGALREPGSPVGTLLPDVATEIGLPATTPVTTVGSHDTASAVVGVPATTERFAYISCGTWSLVGVELDAPVLTEAGRAANFSNELGVDGTVRYLRNVMGLWLLQESLRDWGAGAVELPGLLSAAAGEPGLQAVVDAGDPEFLAPGDMPRRIADACRRTDQPVPQTRAATVRVILDSLALAHRRALRDAIALSDREVDTVHVVGGGSGNTLLCTLTADACGLPVVAGPVEATALGNVLVQARARGVLDGDLSALRQVVARSFALTRHRPDRAAAPAWDEAERRLFPGRP
ncbi:MAG: rhamnulokinase [Pseudonocardia sp.]|nr:rhamnulokinase [Pseudonocardia sp.]